MKDVISPLLLLLVGTVVRGFRRHVTSYCCTMVDPSLSGVTLLVTHFLSLGCETLRDRTDRICHFRPTTTTESVGGGGQNSNEDKVQFLQALSQEQLIQAIQHRRNKRLASSSKAMGVTMELQEEEEQQQTHPPPETKQMTRKSPLQQDMSQKYSSEVSDFRD